MIIGFTGRAQAGKSTAAAYIAQIYGYNRYSFAAPIKGLLNPFFGWDERHSTGDLKEKIDPRWGFSPRAAYQQFGTEFARALNPDFWVNLASARVSPGVDTVIDDVRFENEAAYIRQNGVLIHIERSGLPKIRSHISETPLSFSTRSGDMQINNNGTIQDLHEIIDVLMSIAESRRLEKLAC